MATDPYGQEPAPVQPPAYPIEEVLRLLRQAQPAPPPVAPRPGFLDRLGQGLSTIQAPPGGRAGDQFGANLLAGAARSFGTGRVQARDQQLKQQMQTYESGKQQKALETQAAIGALGKDYESRGVSAKEHAKALAEWRKEKRDYEAKQREKDPATIEAEAFARTKGGNLADKQFPGPTKPGDGVGGDPFDRTLKLRTASLQDPDIKSFIDVRDGYGRVRVGAKDQSAVGDIAVIFGFMKIQDPGSTVREGEYATAENTRGIPDHVRQQYNRLLKGERLAPSQRIGFERVAEKLYQEKRVSYDRAIKGLRSIGDTAGLDPEQYLRDFTADEPFEGGASTTAGDWWQQNAPGGR